MFSECPYTVKWLEFDGKVCGSAVELARHMFDPGRYAARWRFQRADGTVGGIPLVELEASCVREPGCDRLWLLHKKAFKLDSQGRAVADQLVPVCGDCHGALAEKVPKLPKCSLANDMWIGKMPRALTGLSEAAWLLLPLARAFIKRVTLLCDSGKFLPADERIKGFRGNATVFPQADGGKVVLSLPPDQDLLVERLVLAFTGTDDDLRKAYRTELGVDVVAFKAAYQFLRRYNCVYADVEWNEKAAALLEADGERGGAPKLLSRCWDPSGAGEVARMRLEGPDKAGEGGDAEGEEEREEVEDGEFVVGVGEEDVKTDVEKRWLQVQARMERVALLRKNSSSTRRRCVAAMTRWRIMSRRRPGSAWPTRRLSIRRNY